MTPDFISQEPYRCKLDWGVIGTQRTAQRGEVIVLVDTLSFSTTVAHAVSQGGIIYPCSETEEPRTLAEKIGGETAVMRAQVPAEGRYSLSPSTFDNLEPGAQVVLPSLNGATCSRYSSEAAYIFAGALVNAGAVARAVSKIMTDSQLAVTVIACGEREKQPEPHGDLRVAIEDYLGAGAILSNLRFSKSPEARLCEAAFTGSKPHMRELLWESVSGRELRNEGFERDVMFAGRLDVYDIAPILQNGAFRRYSAEYTDL
jgi:2-phosphosulfolactate phosphatase